MTKQFQPSDRVRLTDTFHNRALDAVGKIATIKEVYRGMLMVEVETTKLLQLVYPRDIEHVQEVKS